MANTSLTTLIYGGDPFYTGGDTVIEDLKNSGFTTVVAWSVHVNAPSGDLYLNGTPLVQNGEYVGAPEWAQQLASLKEGKTSVNRLLFSVGSGGVDDFTHIQSFGTDPNGILYKNFQVLLDSIPAIDGIDFDDEDLYDQTTVVDFALMLQAIGYKQVTFCPYTYTEFWVDCLAAINSQAAGFVTGFNLQCYAGGGGNNPQDWIAAVQQKMGSGFAAQSFIYPGVWCSNNPPSCAEGDCPSAVESQFQAWASDGIQGGFIWMYDDIQKCASSGACGSGVSMNTAAYASAIANGLQG
jgi:hypothetical protein